MPVATSDRLNRFLLAAAAVGFAFEFLAPVRADVAYSQNFDSGSATFTVNDPFWVDPTQANGFITPTTNTSVIFPGHPGYFGNDIANDVSGTGYFLFDGTWSYNNGTTIPAGHDEFYISPTFAVTANTNYVISCYLTSAGINNPSVQPELDGQLVGAPVSPVGTFATNGWQEFAFGWNSGANTSASLILHDVITTTTGNDFAIDNITVATAAPEPSTLTVAAVSLLVGVAFLWLRQQWYSNRASKGCFA
jgi:hypothetical protein